MIRKVQPPDFEELLQIEAEAFPKSQYDLGQFWNLHQTYPNTFLVDVTELINGYIVFSLEGHLISMAVRSGQRRKGIGTRLVQEASAYCADTPLLLEVRVSNLGAQEFYLALGFNFIGRAKGYYHDGEDALLMERPAALVSR
ncbi:MAG: GNAT family N-acetyltransferase [Deltaproteobacteria bacterium]|nr:GNAT family N-acetyltransferase [Deltaproteobacteria bacterium]